MIASISKRLLFETRKKALWKFAWNFGAKGGIAAMRHRRAKKGVGQFPPFLFISLTNRCNLRCQGCWVHSGDREVDMSIDDADSIVRQSKEQGVRFFGLLGGEPLLHADLLELPARHPDCYFQLFTNGMLLTDEIAREMARLGNVTPLVSIEGLEETSVERRGGGEVYRRSMEGIAHCREQGLVIGVATSVCRSNIEELATERFLRDLVERGVHYAWYYIYRPVGSNPTPELALSKEQILDLRRFLVDVRTRVPIIVVDAYWDHKGRAICPAALGLSYHVNALGDIEPCPPIQFANENALNGRGLNASIRESDFLQRFSEVTEGRTSGCILLEDPKRLREYVGSKQARDTSGRDGFSELEAMSPLPSHDLPGEEIPEKHWFYRFAKKYAFFGFGAYG